VRTARLSLTPGGSTDATAAPGVAPRLPSWLGRAEVLLRGWVGSRSLTPWVGFLAVLLALLLGGAHAALPGHGKTVMAAYLAGRQGRPRDALAVGATVTLTHTGGVLILGLLLTTAAGLAGETVLGWLGVVSGLLVATVGVTMLRRRRAHSHGPHAHSHSHGDHSHHHHDHSHPHPPARPSRWTIVGMGVAGGLVPSPSALVVLLGAIGLGRTWFGVLLVLAYGAGMAAVLTAAGLLLIRVRDRWPARLHLSPKLTAWAPNGTAALVLLVGSALAIRSFVTL
jgi:ABC-type nickel/cobalt efflux system permease component RcnA